MITVEDLKDQSKYKKLVDYFNQRIDDYYTSKCYRSLCGRMDRLYNLIYMNKDSSRNAYTGANEWMSKITVPLVREMYLVLRAAMKKSWIQDPLITLEPIGNTPYDNAQNSQDVLNLNYMNTQYRDRVLREIYRSTAGYGTSITFSQFEMRNNSSKRTAYDPVMGYYKADTNDLSANCWNYVIPIKHYFQNPDISDFDHTDYKGHVKRFFLTDLIAEVKRNPDLYLKERLKKIIDEARSNALKSSNILNREKAIQDRDISVDVYQYVGNAHIKGNELDDTEYVVWIAGEHIFRFSPNENDYGIDGYSCFNVDKFQDYWWSNTPIENVISHENIMTIVMQMSMDNAMRQLERYIFFDEGAIDFADIANRHKNDGFIGVRVKDMPIQNMFSEYQRKSTNLQDLQYMMNEAKEAAQRVSVKADLSRQGLPGGPRNETLGAAQMLVEQGQTQEFDLFDNMAYGFKQNARNNLILLQQNLPLEFGVRNFQKKQDRMLELKDILGDYAYNVETSLTKNTVGEVQRLSNVITMLLNWKGTGNPSFANVDQGITKLAREVIKKNNLPNIDAEEMFPDQQAMPGMMPEMQTPGLPVDQGVNAQAVPVSNQPQPIGMGMAA
jgi:hypothetical protein